MPPRPRQRRLPHRPLERPRSQRQQPFDERQERHAQRSVVRRIGVDRADLLAHVAAEDPVADGLRLPLAQYAAMLDGQVADAASRVDGLRRHQRARWAAGQAAGAAPAVGADRLIHGQLGRAQDGAQEHPRSGAIMGQQVRVLADPAQPGPRGQRSLRQRPIIDVRRRARRQPRCTEVGRQPLQPAPQGDVVVAARRVSGDPAGWLSRLGRQHRCQRPMQGIWRSVPRASVGAAIWRRDHDHRPRIRLVLLHVGGDGRSLAAHPVHVAHAAGGDALLHARAVIGQWCGVRHADQQQPVLSGH